MAMPAFALRRFSGPGDRSTSSLATGLFSDRSSDSLSPSGEPFAFRLLSKVDEAFELVPDLGRHLWSLN